MQFFKISIIASIVSLVLISCNKLDYEAVPITQETPGGQTLETILNDASYSFFKSAATKAGILPKLANAELKHTIFLPNDNAFRASLPVDPAAFIAGSSPETLAGLIGYHIMPQKISSASIPAKFPNFFYPSLVNPSPAASNLLRLNLFPSKRGSSLYVNNYPVSGAEINASNGAVFPIPYLLQPPTQMYLQRIAADTSLSYLHAAILRADSGVVAQNSSSIVWLMSNFGPDFTLFAPTNTAFRTLLTGAIAQALIARGTAPATALAQAAALAATPGVFSEPTLFPVLTAATIKGILFYHILPVRAFSVNLPNTATAVPTLINQAVPVHPGVTLTAAFASGQVAAATVKGLMNATASNILINPTPGTGSSDQNYVNGVLYKIDQVLMPQ